MNVIAFTHLCAHHVRPDAGAELEEEDEGEEHGEGDGHAVVLLDGAAAPEERHEEDDAAHHHQQHRRVEELRVRRGGQFNEGNILGWSLAQEPPLPDFMDLRCDFRSKYLTTITVYRKSLINRAY